jgi:hypothetical protein
VSQVLVVQDPGAEPPPLSLTSGLSPPTAHITQRRFAKAMRPQGEFLVGMESGVWCAKPHPVCVCMCMQPSDIKAVEARLENLARKDRYESEVDELEPRLPHHDAWEDIVKMKTTEAPKRTPSTPITPSGSPMPDGSAKPVSTSVRARATAASAGESLADVSDSDSGSDRSIDALEDDVADELRDLGSRHLGSIMPTMSAATGAAVT